MGENPAEKELTFKEKCGMIGKALFGTRMKRVVYPDNQPFVVLESNDECEIFMSDSEIRAFYRFFYAKSELTENDKFLIIKHYLELGGRNVELVFDFLKEKIIDGEIDNEAE